MGIQTKRITVNGVRINIYDSGMERDYDTGLTIIFLHGSPGQISNWKYQLRYFRDFYRVVAYDQRGYGESDKPPEVSLEDYILDLHALISYLGVGDAVIVGHSFGGMVAQEYASRYDVRGLVLIGSLARLEPDLIDMIVWHLPPLLWRRLLFTENMLTRRLYRRVFFSPEASEDIYMEFIKDNKDYLESLPPHVFRYLRFFKGYMADESVVKINAPTLIIVGRDDKVTPVEQSKLLHDLIPSSRLQIIDGAGHLVLYEKPFEINKLIHEFIGDISP